MASDEVLKFLKHHNRPFSANDIMQSIKDSGKSAILKALDKLVAKNEVLEKSYGKQKVYCIVQDSTNTGNSLNEDLKALDREINDYNAKLKDVEEKLLTKTNEFKLLEGQKTLEEAQEENKLLVEEVEGLKRKLEKFDENFEPISDEEKAKIFGEKEKYVKEYKKRRRMCMDIVGAIMENYPKSKKQLFEDVGIETDEEVGFVLKEG